jgi:peptide/nickel transport system substrate-binding protein
LIRFDRVIHLAMTDSSVRLANLQAGAIDIAEYIVPTDAKTVEADKRLKLVVSEALGYHGITNNLANRSRYTPYGNDPRVRPTGVQYRPGEGAAPRSRRDDGSHAGASGGE